MERRGKVRVQKHRNGKDEILMSDYSKLNNMSREELLDFARFAYVAYPTLLETHERRTQFFKDYPDKDPNRDTEGPYQLELPLV